MTKLYTQIASKLLAIQNCKSMGAHHAAQAETCETAAEQVAHYNGMISAHTADIESLVRNRLPFGNGFDSGTKLDFAESKPDKLVFLTEFHHMTEGSYDGWTEHVVAVRPSLAFGIDLKVSGYNQNDIREHIVETFHHALTQDVE